MKVERSKIENPKIPNTNSPDFNVIAWNAALGMFLLNMSQTHPQNSWKDSLLFAGDVAIGALCMVRASRETLVLVTGKVDRKETSAVSKFDGRNMLTTLGILALAGKFGLPHEYLMYVGCMSTLAFDALIQPELAKKYLAKQGMINS